MLPLGPRIDPGTVRGYYIDFRSKTDAATWPPPWFPWPGFHRFMGIAQWGLGAFERYLADEGEEWLAGAAAAAEYVVREQQEDGGWLEPRGHPHTFHTPVPWLSAMAQGQCASLLARVARETGEEGLVEAAARGLRPMLVPVARGGVQARLDGGLFLEEYPTDPPSFVLNGGIFALWGAFDVWRGRDDDLGRRIFMEATEALAASLPRWDTGFWSRYDLFPHRIVNVASRFYHLLHIEQLRALELLSQGHGFGEMSARFERYLEVLPNRARALAQKVAFRLLVRKRLRRS